MKKRFIPYGKQWITSQDIDAVASALRSDFITQGPAIESFEQKLAAFCGAKYCVAVNSGTAALHCAYFASGLTYGDEFITSPNTFVATANAGLYLGAKPVFVDVEADTGNIDVSLIEKKINKKTKLIVPVHYSGHPVNLEKIRSLADKYNLFVVEDACHALGARYKQSKIGSCKYSDLTVLSFHPVKHITTGEGGAVLTNDRKLYNRMIMFRTHGIRKDISLCKAKGPWFYEMHFLGYNYRITDFQAALGMSQLKKIDKFIEKRIKIAQRYMREFEGNPYFDLPQEKAYAHSSFHLFPIRIKKQFTKKKKSIFSMLRDEGIGVQCHYIPVYLQPYYKKLGYKEGICPVSEKFYAGKMSIPMYPMMNDSDITYVINKINRVFNKIHAK